MATSAFRLVLNRNIEAVWNLIASFEKYEEWRTDLQKIEILSENEFVEHTTDTYVTKYVVKKMEPHDSIELEMDNMNLKGHWIIRFIDKGNHTEFHLRANVSAKKIHMAPFVRSYLKVQQTRYISDLKQALE